MQAVKAAMAAAIVLGLLLLLIGFLLDYPPLMIAGAVLLAAGIGYWLYTLFS